jgi:hypothetical protein
MKRICTKCGEEKEIERFVKQAGKYRKDPYRRDCKDCKNKKRRKGTIGGRFEKGMIPWNKGRSDLPSSWIKGKKLSKERIEKTASKIRGRGKGRWTYNYHQWRQKVFERDNHRCTKCGIEKRLHCHHKIPWKDDENLRFSVDNGETLCISCHMSLEGYEKGRKITEETRKKMSESKKGMIPWNKGKKSLKV